MAKNPKSEFNNAKEPVEDLDVLQEKAVPTEAVEKKEIKKEISTDSLSGKIEPAVHMSQGMETTKDNVQFKNTKVAGGIISGNGRSMVR